MLSSCYCSTHWRLNCQNTVLRSTELRSVFPGDSTEKTGTFETKIRANQLILLAKNERRQPLHATMQKKAWNVKNLFNCVNDFKNLKVKIVTFDWLSIADVCHGAFSRRCHGLSANDCEILEWSRWRFFLASHSGGRRCSTGYSSPDDVSPWCAG